MKFLKIYLIYVIKITKIRIVINYKLDKFQIKDLRKSIQCFEHFAEITIRRHKIKLHNKKKINYDINRGLKKLRINEKACLSATSSNVKLNVVKIIPCQNLQLEKLLF